ncbi:dynein axonemal intermediate chain 4 [Trichomycterus rosablanca]|uniref:dynein axonemal intermediate chain 4 n=1 Tax=Trichomycterus rosablanca TaxID=2290929 RepID=UPI002F355A95
MSKTTTRPVRPAVKIPQSSGSGARRISHGSTNTRSVYASVSRRGSTLAGDSKVFEKSSTQPHKHPVQVLDETGKDVTPQPLYQPEPGAGQIKPTKIFTAHETSWGTNSDFMSISCQTTNASFAAPFTRSSTVSRSSLSTMESMSDETEDPSPKKDASIGHTDTQDERDDVRDHQLDAVVDTYLTETETLWLLDLPPVCVSEDSDDAELVKERNEAYTELCKTRAGNDKYVERSAQTFNGAPKSKEVQCDSVVMVDKGTTATVWEMYDTYAISETEESDMATDGERSTIPDGSSVHRLDSTLSFNRAASVSSTSMVSSSSSHIETDAFVVQVDADPDPERILNSEKFLNHLLAMERTVLQNVFQPKLAAYRRLPVLTDPDQAREENEVQEDDPLGPALERLWTFGCELTTGRNVSCMSWNEKNPDLLAVGYGQFDFKEQKSGLVCCWSLKNPTWPERIFHCGSGVTSLDFSASSAAQLAVGMYDGSVAIYNVQSSDKTPIFNSSDCAHRHAGPVWQVRWVDHDRGPKGEKRDEALVSVSADGRISEWFVRKGLDCKDLMKLKRTKNEKRHEGKKEPLTSHLAPGLCLDFHPDDPNFYLAGTEEGHVYKCSCSTSEQFLESYTAHRGPVYKIAWSPLCPDVFLSCSADWTVQLWRQDLSSPVLAFTSTQTGVYDVAWCPRRATVFGAVHHSRVEIWDLAASTLYPTIVNEAEPGVALSSISFTNQADCVLVGDSEGRVSVYKLKNLTVVEGTQGDKLDDMIKTTLTSQLRDKGKIWAS